jgi:arabinose-5-phosphate isomerase
MSKLKPLELGKFIIANEINALVWLKENLGPSFETVVELIASNQGDLILTGVGKSGLVAQKIASTLVSSGIRAFFLHATEAMHGDFGLVSADDVVILISHSGETEEVLRLIKPLREIGVTLVAITSSADSTLAKNADYLLLTGVKEEACPEPYCSYNLVPTTSTTVTSVLGDALALILREKKAVSKEEHARYHRGGAIGKKLKEAGHV